MDLMLLFAGISEELDVSFALDSSDGVSKAAFEKMKDFIRGSLKAYNITANQTRVSLVSYGSHPISHLQMKDGVYRSVVEQALSSIPRVGGTKKLSDALTFISETFTNREDAGRLLILIDSETDDQLKDDSSMKRALDDLEKRNMKLVVVRIGKRLDDKPGVLADAGKTILVDDPKNLKSAFSEVVDESAKAAGMKIAMFFL